jgi:hypothetical protein
MTFGLSAAAIAVGVGMSAAGAAGAFSNKVDAMGPTPEEQQAAQYNKQVFEQGQAFQKQMDPVYLNRLDKNLERTVMGAADIGQYGRRLGGLKRELGQLGSGQRYQMAADQATNQAWANIPEAGQGAARRGGVGSGQFFAGLGTQGNAMDAAVKGANVGGRLGWLDETQKFREKYGQQREQFGQRLDAFGGQVASQLAATQGLYGDYANRLSTGIDLMNQGAGQAAESQQNRINAQVRDNMGRNQAMGQLGGSLMSVGMMGVGMGGGLGGAGAAAGGVKPTMAGAMDPRAGAPYGGYQFVNPRLR